MNLISRAKIRNNYELIVTSYEFLPLNNVKSDAKGVFEYSRSDIPDALRIDFYALYGRFCLERIEIRAHVTFFVH